MTWLTDLLIAVLIAVFMALFIVMSSLKIMVTSIWYIEPHHSDVITENIGDITMMQSLAINIINYQAHTS